MIGLQLPRLFGTRAAVAELMHRADVPDQFDGSDVVVDASELAAGTSSAADELVRELVVIRGAAKLVLIGGPDAFLGFLRESGERYGVADRLQETELDVPDVHYV